MKHSREKVPPMVFQGEQRWARPWKLFSPLRRKLYVKGALKLKISGGGFFFFLINSYFIYLFIYLFLAVLGLRFCARAFSSCGKRGLLFIAMRGPLTAAASLVAEHRL